MRRRILIGVATIFALLVVLALGASQFRLSALQEPGAVETYAATAAKRWFVGQGAREVEVPTVVDEAKGVARGKLLYGANCSFCHGVEGKRPLQFGLWMYPRSPDLNESLIRQWTDAELFWIIQNGIRMTGMPGFDHILPDEDIAALTRYLRSLGPPPEE